MSRDVIVVYAGRRYGGFRDEDAARAFIRKMGWMDATITTVSR